MSNANISDIAIKLSVNADGVSKGFRTAAEEARSYKAELDRLVYAVGRSEPVDYNAHVTQYTQATNERLAKEKKAQEEFNAWYRGEADREFQAWYAVELKKEQVREQQLADERQRAINTSNAQNSQRQLPAETAARGDENAALREAITQRFALRDVEDRAIAANVANRDAAQRRAVADAAQAQQQELADLRQAITQRYALRDQEERQEQLYAANMANIARMQAERAQQAAAAADAQRDSDFAQYKADLARQEAAGMVNAERTARIERARQRDAKRAADDDRVRQLNDWRMQQALMQRAAVDTQLTVGRMAGGFGGAAMAMGQASYAAEDFIQVLSMGGGMNMALMSASNNLSMVVRSLAGTSMALSAVAGLAVPMFLIGTNLLIQYLSQEEDQIDAVTRAYKRLHEELSRSRDALNQQIEHRVNMQDIDELATYAAALAKLRQEIRALAQAEAEAADMNAELALKRKELRDAVAGGEIIGAAERRLRAMQESPELFDQTDIARAKEDVENLTEAYTELSAAMSSGSADQIIQAAELLREEIRNTKELGPNFGGFAAEAEAHLAAILGSDDEVARLEAIRALLADLAAINGEVANGAEAAAKAQETTNRLLRQENQLRQDNIRFQLEATDAQKEAADLQNQLSAFLGIDNSNPMQGMNPDDMSAEQARQSAEFLELMWRNLDRQKKEILDEKQRVTPVGGLEQNTYQAQADAFRQILEATNRQEDPQLTAIVRQQEITNDLLEDITGIRIVQ